MSTQWDETIWWCILLCMFWGVLNYSNLKVTHLHRLQSDMSLFYAITAPNKPIEQNNKVQIQFCIDYFDSAIICIATTIVGKMVSMKPAPTPFYFIFYSSYSKPTPLCHLNALLCVCDISPNWSAWHFIFIWSCIRLAFD